MEYLSNLQSEIHNTINNLNKDSQILYWQLQLKQNEIAYRFYKNEYKKEILQHNNNVNIRQQYIYYYNNVKFCRNKIKSLREK